MKCETCRIEYTTDAASATTTLCHECFAKLAPEEQKRLLSERPPEKPEISPSVGEAIKHFAIGAGLILMGILMFTAINRGYSGGGTGPLTLGAFFYGIVKVVKGTVVLIRVLSASK